MVFGLDDEKGLSRLLLGVVSQAASNMSRREFSDARAGAVLEFLEGSRVFAREYGLECADVVDSLVARYRRGYCGVPGQLVLPYE